MTLHSFIFKNFFYIVILSISFINYVFAKENYLVTVVNNIPITKVDIVNKAKLISISIDKNSDFKNLENYYDLSHKTLINEKIIFSAGKKINKNLDTIVSKRANKLLLAEFGNSELKLNDFIKKFSVPKSTLLEKYKAQIIWGIVLKDKYNIQFSKINKNIDQKIQLNKKQKSQDLYDLAEIVINRKNNDKLLENINNALERGISFIEIAKQVSISNSSKFGGKIGWKNYKNLPDYIKRKEKLINEGDIYIFDEKDKVKIIKILVKRINGNLSKKEDVVLLAEAKFPLNFQKKTRAYEEVKNKLELDLLNKKSCKALSSFKKQKNREISLKMINSRIADMSPKIQNLIKNTSLLSISKPFFYGNYGYSYIKCDSKTAKLEKFDYKKLKSITLNKYFLIYSEKLLKRLNNEANIIEIEKIK